MNEEITVDMVWDPKCSPEVLKMALEREKDDVVSHYAAQNPNCPLKALQKVLERGNDDGVSWFASGNINCSPEVLIMVLERKRDDYVSRNACVNINCPPQSRLKWLMAVGRIKTPDLSKHDVQIIKNNNKPDEEWEQFKKMVEDE